MQEYLVVIIKTCSNKGSSNLCKVLSMGGLRLRMIFSKPNSELSNNCVFVKRDSFACINLQSLWLRVPRITIHLLANK